MRLGIICPSEIAMRRFLPSISSIDGIDFAGVAVNSAKERYGKELPASEVIDEMLEKERNKAQKMVHDFGGRVYNSYYDIVSSPDIDAIYLPLPPALHYRWAKKALEYGKHILVEKPATTAFFDTKDLISYARSKKLAVHENYMFIFHNQITAIDDIIASGELGDIKQFRVSFGFPMRAATDFRYKKALGGGALLDAGGYTIKYASYLLGETAKLVYGHLSTQAPFDVDMFGSGVLINENGVTAHISFGMDNEYKCELEVWGSKGTLVTGRVLTAPADFEPVAKIVQGGKESVVSLPSDDAFRKSIIKFIECIEEPSVREANYEAILQQSHLVQEFADFSTRF